MLFSVIIPTYNREQYLRDTLASVLQQTFNDFEIIVVDDGSTDGTVAYLSSLKGKLTLIQQSNAGPGAARNLGMQHATGEYLAFLDSDDLWFPWTLETYAEVIRTASKPAFIAGKPLLFRSEAELAQASAQPTTILQFRDYLATNHEWRWLGASAFVVRRDAALGCGGFAQKNMNAEDADLALKLGTAPGFVQVGGPATLAYREHAANITMVLEKTLTGLWYIINTENAGGYPGGAERARERWRIISYHVRPILLTCLQTGDKRAEAWRMYRATLRWHLATSRWKFLLGFPLKAVRSARRSSAPALV
ncbi:glycosyl transferase family 2 [Roseimicrobium gellanilyticum]|uniref:Glycosyl transferase family 2 n=1 Tax=Roseimicrobium gellanilyticum TaxID=748857 RepID=A0A366HP93_9BACT|nr:glycosyltransferase family A protein [Roseimicrobium gellanilyticum]RBP45315.1 glycosyl transferase family 2 [Roseimicrobium gellanilyticum]